MVPVLFWVLICVVAKKDTDVSMSWKAQMGRSSLNVLFAWEFGVIMGAAPFVIGGSYELYLMLRLCAIQIKKKISPGSNIDSPHYIKAS